MIPALARQDVEVIDRETKKALGQMVKGVQVVGASHDGVARAYTSHWVCQVSFDEPIVMASVSPKHDTHPLIIASGRFAVSVLAADQITEGQYFSYPGRRFAYVAPEYLDLSSGLPVVPGAVSWFHVEVEEVISGRYDHDLVFGRVVASGVGRVDEPPLLYSSRHGWRVTGGAAREPGVSIRDQLLERVAHAELATEGETNS